MKFPVIALLLSVVSIAIVPITVLVTYANFGAEDVNLELLHANMVRGHYLFLAVSTVCLGVIVYTLAKVQKSSSVVIVISAAIVFLLISSVLYGPSIVQGLGDLAEIEELLKDD